MADFERDNERFEEMPQPIHPGFVLQELLVKRGITQDDLAQRISVTRASVNGLCNGHRDMSPEMAWRIAKALGTSVEYWTNLQTQFILWRVRRKIARDLAKIKALEAA